MRYIRLVTAVVLALGLAIAFRIANPKADSVWFAVAAGVFSICAVEVAVIICDLSQWWFQKRKVQTVLGNSAFDANDPITLYYTPFEFCASVSHLLAGSGIDFPHISQDDPVPTEKGKFRVEKPIASHDLKAILEVGKGLYRRGATYQIRPSVKDDPTLDASFITFGGAGEKARHVLEQLAELGYRLAEARPPNTSGSGAGYLNIVDSNGREFMAPPAGWDIAFIIKLHPAPHPERTWLLCMGLSGTGTAAGGYLLGKRLHELSALSTDDGRVVGDRPFVIAAPVRLGDEQMADLSKARIVALG
jgi:hypothetical protein